MLIRFKCKNKTIQNLLMRIQWQSQTSETNKKHLILDCSEMIRILKKRNLVMNYKMIVKIKMKVISKHFQMKNLKINLELIKEKELEKTLLLKESANKKFRHLT
jgi:hypothetical protein